MNAPTPDQRLLGILTGNWLAASLHAATILGIPDLLAAGARSVEDLAEVTGTKVDPLRRTLRALVAHGVFAERDDGRFEQTEMSNLLRADVVGSRRSLLLLIGGAVISTPWGEMLHSLRTGATAFSKVHGVEIFEYLRGDAQETATYNKVMTQGSALLAEEIIHAYDFSGFRTIVDVGGGQGWLLTSILTAIPTARGILLDRPDVTKSAQSVVKERGVADRCEVIAGNFFEAIPQGGDAYITKWVIHNWSDEDARKILRNVRSVIPRDGRLIICDRVIPERITDGDPVLQYNTLMDVNMLVNITGRERTEGEFRELLRASGFKMSSVRSVPSGFGIVEGTPL
jgi:orsellinic acid C2-O-methyltransferase